MRILKLMFASVAAAALASAIMGARAAMRAGTEIQALAFTTEASRAYMSTFRRDGSSVKQQLDQRDTTFGDYRARKT